MKPNILLLTIDSLRADHLGCYGYHHNTSPHIDALAAEGVLAERFFSEGIPTHPSYTTLYTGQHAITHGIISQGGKARLDVEAPFLPQLLLEAGYTTCAVDNLWRMRPWFGRGYEYYIDPSVRRNLVLSVDCEEINDRAISWMQAHHDKPFFLFLHYWDPHFPYTPPDRYRNLFYEGKNPTDPDNHSLDAYWKQPLGSIARETWLRTANGPITDAEYVVALYDGEVRRVDEGIGQILEALNNLGSKQQTLVILLADHGESLANHGIYFNHAGLYDCTTHVPFIARLTGHLPEGVRLPQMVQHHDVTATILEAAGLPIPTVMDGQSFWKLLTGQKHEWTYNRAISLECSWQAKWSLRNDRYKFILARHQDSFGNPLRELYDLNTDPGEEHNIALELPEIAVSMEEELEGWITEHLQALGKNEDPVREQSASLRSTWEALQY